MASLQYSSQINELSSFNLRRSDRKKTKKIIKDDFNIPNPFKGVSKKQKIIRLPHNLDIQIKKIQFFTERSLAMLNYGRRQFSVQMLNEMKQAVNQQQNKLSEFLPIKEKNNHDTKIFAVLVKNYKFNEGKQNIEEIPHNNFDVELDKQVAGISTAEELYCSLSEESQNVNDDIISAFDEESEYCILEVPRCRKQSSKLLSDNYENNELFYTFDHLVPSWHKDEQMLNQQQYFMQ